MKLAEALTQRADLQTRLVHLAQRARDNVRYQEGEQPAEDTNELLAEYDRVTDDLDALIVRINVQNLATEVAPGLSMTAALSRRDILRKRQKVRSDLADTASEAPDRYTRTELRTVSAVNVRALRAEADDLAKQARELDTRIQSVNWTTDMGG